MLVVSFEQLQKIAQHAGYHEPLLFSMGASLTASWLHGFSQRHSALLVLCHDNQFFIAQNGRVASQRAPHEEKIWRVTTAAKASVFWMQNPAKPFEATVTSLIA